MPIGRVLAVFLAILALPFSVRAQEGDPFQGPPPEEVQRKFRDAMGGAPWEQDLGKPAPTLLASAWDGSPVTLRAVRGNTVVLVFWNADLPLGRNPQRFLKNIMEDYDKYKGYRNLTFVSICFSIVASPKTFQKQVQSLGLKPFATMLDSAAATATAYKVPKNVSSWLVVIDGEGNIAFNSLKGWQWRDGDNEGKTVYQTQIEASLEKCPGILGRTEIPPGFELAAHYFDLQQFQLLEAELKRAESKDGGKEAKEFAAYVRQQVADTRKARVEEITALAETQPAQAYREALAFAAAFPGTPEKSTIRELANELLKKPDVKRELAAEEAYRRVLVPQMRPVARDFEVKAQAERLKPLLDEYLKVYGTTEYAKAVTDAVEPYQMAEERSR